MPRTVIASIAVFGLVFTFAACKSDGGDDSGADDGPAPAQPIPEDELPEAAAAALCELFFECSCESANYPDEPTCVDTRRSTTSDDQLAAQAAGLTYDAQCAGDLLALAEAAGCVAQYPLDCDTYCAAYHGAQGVGQPCTMPVETQPTWSDCAAGLWCLAGTCEDPCGAAGVHLGEGDACRNEMGESLGMCDAAPGLWCDFESMNCIALPGVGEPCYGSEICGAGATCDWSGDTPTCVPIPKEGEACVYVCDVGSYCNGVDGAEGICVALPGAGEACPQGECAEGSFCNAEVMCEELPAWVCST